MNFTRGVIAFLLGFALVGLFQQAHGRDLGQWTNNDPVVSEWFRNLMMPDEPAMSCCGEADAYWCDDINVKTGADNRQHTYCKITDDRPDAPRMRPHRDIGEEFEVPDYKLKWDRGNPIGHAIIFLGVNGNVYCFVQSSGV